MLFRSFLSVYLPEKYDAKSSDANSVIASATLSPILRGAQDTAKSTPIRGYITLIFGLLFQIQLGMLWTYGNVIPYIASYVTYYESSATVLNGKIYHRFYSFTNWSFFLLFMALTFGVLIGGKCEIYFGPKISICISSVFVILGFGGTFFALLLHNIYAVLLTYGLLFGFGIGLGYPIVAVVCMRWFPHNRGTICGIVSGVFGGSPLLWDYIQTYIVNPTGVALDPEIGYANNVDIINRIPYMFLYISGLQMGMQMLALSVLINPPWYVPERKQNKNDASDANNVSAEQLEYEMHSLNMKMTLRLPTFWSLWINNFLFSFVLMWVAAEWKEFAMLCLKIDSDQYLAIIGSLSAGLNGLGRFGWGFIYDWNKSFPISMGTITGVVAVMVATMPMINFWTAEQASKILFAIWIFAIWICVGCQYAFLPTCIAETFGAKYVGSIVGLFVWCEAPSSLLVVVCTQFSEALFHGWTGYCLFIGACSAVSFILSLFYKAKIDRKAILQSAETK